MKPSTNLLNKSIIPSRKSSTKCVSARTRSSSRGSNNNVVIASINNQASQLEQQTHKCKLPNYESPKYSNKRNGIIKAYAANSNQGIYRSYNEDRVSIILNIVKPKCKEHIEKWPKCAFFGIYDGHGGSLCADFLRDNLHQFIVRDEHFPDRPKLAI